MKKSDKKSLIQLTGSNVVNEHVQEFVHIQTFIRIETLLDGFADILFPNLHSELTR